jgi:hypothetical protein
MMSDQAIQKGSSMGAPALRLRAGLQAGLRVGMGSGLLASALLVPGQAAARDGGGWRQSGQASWYGGRHAGHRTSSGTVFNPTEMTAAHPSLPLGSRVLVTMRDTGDSVVVTVTDRQPDHGRRIIDLSRGAAERIGLASRGVGEVTIEPAGHAAPIEVADAPALDGAGSLDDASTLDGVDVLDGAAFGPGATPAPRGRRHTLRAGPAASAVRPYYRVRFEAPARSSARRRAGRHTL